MASDGNPPPNKKSKQSAPITVGSSGFNSSSINDWHPDTAGRGPLPPACLSRVTRELLDLVAKPLPGITALQDEEDMGVVHALVVGPEKTPYQGGFFYFLMRVTDRYPMHPPKVRLVTTGDGKVRFNPNLYANGKVCLSILGTWSGPCWTPAMGLRAVLLSIQSLLNERPFCNEPGREHAPQREWSMYNEVVQHETIRVAVCDMMEGRVQTLPVALRTEMQSVFGSHLAYYTDLCRRNASRDGTAFRDPLTGSNRTTCQYGDLLRRLDDISVRLATEASTVGGQ